MRLRPYQDDLITAVRPNLKRGEPALMVLPTGGGKTVIFSWITDKVQGKGKRVLLMAHRREIVLQISKSLREMGVRHGLVMPGFRMTLDPVQVGMVQTIARRLDQLGLFDLLVVDEAHHAAAGTWKAVMSAYQKSRVLGVTATPERLDGKGLGEHFKTMVEGPSTGWLIEQGFLSSYRYLAPPNALDMSQVKMQMGDYKKSDAKRQVDKPKITGDAVEHYATMLNGAPAVAFCVDVGHAQHVADAFQAQGWRAAVIEGTQDPTERQRRVDDLGSGRLNVLVSCEVISEGFDLPVVAGAILLRPTKSLSMYLQQVGRALRPIYAPGMPKDTPEERRAAMAAGPKPYAVILDHVGNIIHHGPPDMQRAWSLGGRSAQARASVSGNVRICSGCFRVFQIGATVDCANVEDCPLLNPTGKARPEEVAGTLVDIKPDGDWTGGIPLTVPAGSPDGVALVERAKTLPQLRQIAKARNYRRGWATNYYRARERKQQAGDD